MNDQGLRAKAALDNLIRISRTHLYKPIQIAEILYYNRQFPDEVSLLDLETYRTQSKHWRDRVTLRLVGTVSTSNSRYQDDLFNEHAIPPHILNILGKINRQYDGVIENYIYHRFRQRQIDVLDAYDYLQHATPATFSLDDFLIFFEQRPGLKRSIDKAFEMITYALFSTIIDKLDIWITVEVRNSDDEAKNTFLNFLKLFFGEEVTQNVVEFKAQIYRSGVTNAADRGLDMWANFGSAIQVKHISINEDIAVGISDSIRAEHIIVVCRTADKAIIQTITSQLGLRIRGIVTQNELNEWYSLSLKQYPDDMGEQILRYLRDEFRQEFTFVDQLDSFFLERGYDATLLIHDWKV